MRYEEAKSFFVHEMESAFYEGIEEVKVIHGVGTYALRNMVLAEVEKVDYIEILPQMHNPGTIRLKLLVPDIELRKKYL